MATHKSAEKRIRQTEKRTAINRSRMSRVRTFVKKVETAIATGDRQEAQSAFQVAQPELHRAITKGVCTKTRLRASSRASPPASTRSECALRLALPRVLWRVGGAPRVTQKIFARSPFGRVAIVSTRKLAFPYCAIINHAGAL